MGISGPLRNAREHVDQLNLLQSITVMGKAPEPYKISDVHPFETQTYCPELYEIQMGKNNLLKKSNQHRVVKDIVDTIDFVQTKKEK